MRRRWLIVLALVGLCASCTAEPSARPTPGRTTPSATPTSVRASPTSFGNWFTYHHDALRTGAVDGTRPLGSLHRAWSARLDGAVYGQPLVVGGRVIVATEKDSVYALRPSGGRVMWRRRLGTPVPLRDLPCGNIDPLGITSTPVFDPHTGLVFVAGEETGPRFFLAGLDPATGKVRMRRTVTPPGSHTRYQQQRPALAVENGRVYVAFGGLNGDCGTYFGSVVAVPTSGRGPELSYRVPTSNRGAIWAPAGPVVAHDGTIFVATGNSAASRSSDPWDGGDSVIALSPRLRQRGYFAPRSWAHDNVTDADLGSMSPALLPGRGLLVIAGKNGTAYLVRTRHLGGIGDAVAAKPVCDGFGGAAVNGSTVYLPCINGGLAAVHVRGNRMTVAWRGPSDGNGSPVLGGGAVWTVAWPAGRLYALDPGSGRVRASIDLGEVPHFASPTLSGGLALVGTVRGVVAVSGA